MFSSQSGSPLQFFRNPPDVGERDRMTTYVYQTPNLDEAIWDAALAVGEGRGRVYIVEPIGQVEACPMNFCLSSATTS